MKTMVEDIRVKLASGLYDSRDLWLSMRNLISYEDFKDIMTFTTYQEVRPDLQARVKELEIANSAYANYQEELQREAAKAEAAELSGVKHYPFTERAEVLKAELDDQLRGLTSVNALELAKFYLIGESLIS